MKNFKKEVGWTLVVGKFKLKFKMLILMFICFATWCTPHTDYFEEFYLHNNKWQGNLKRWCVAIWTFLSRVYLIVRFVLDYLLLHKTAIKINNLRQGFFFGVLGIVPIPQPTAFPFLTRACLPTEFYPRKFQKILLHFSLNFWLLFS